MPDGSAPRVPRDAHRTPRRTPLVSSRAVSPRSLPSCLSHQSTRTVRCGRPAPVHGVRSRNAIATDRRTGRAIRAAASSPRPSADLAIVRRVRVDARERLAGPAGPRLVGGGERTSAGIRCRAPGCDIAPVPVLAERLPDRRTQVLCAATWTSHAAHPVRRAVWRAINRRRCIIVTTAVSCCTCVRE